MKRIRLHGADDPQAVLPKFTTVVSGMRLDEFESDLVLVPMLYKMQVPQSLHADDPTMAEKIKLAIKEAGFEGKRGTHLVIDTTADDATSDSRRYVLLVGLGRPDCFKADVASDVFERLTDEAVRLGVRNVTVPFISNRMTRECLNFKGMAHRLKLAVASRLGKTTSPVALEEVKIICSTQARRFVRQGLEIPVDEKAADCGCS